MLDGAAYQRIATHSAGIACHAFEIVDRFAQVLGASTPELGARLRAMGLPQRRALAHGFGRAVKALRDRYEFETFLGESGRLLQRAGLNAGHIPRASAALMHAIESVSKGGLSPQLRADWQRVIGLAAGAMQLPGTGAAAVRKAA